MSSHILIDSRVLSTNTQEVSFTSIPSAVDGKNLRDLVLVCSVTTDVSNSLGITLNNDSSSIYHFVTMEGSGTTTSSYAATFGILYGAVNNINVSSTRSSHIYQVFDYTQTNKHKQILVRSDNAAFVSSAVGARYASTNAITSLEVKVPTNTRMLPGSTLSLYGIEG